MGNKRIKSDQTDTEIANTDSVEPQDVKKTGEINNKKSLSTLIVIVLVLLLALLSVILNSKHLNLPDTDSADKVQDINSKDYASKIEALKNQISNADKNDEKLIKNLNLQLADTYNSNGNVQEALSLYDNLDKNGQMTADSYLVAAGIAERSGNIELAIKYYQAAIDIYPINAPRHDFAVNEITAKIQELSQ